jgi:hypothetical protein
MTQKLAEHYSKMCFITAKHMAWNKKYMHSKANHNKGYVQGHWESYLRDEAIVIDYANRLMKLLEEENKVMLELFNKGILK